MYNENILIFDCFIYIVLVGLVFKYIYDVVEVLGDNVMVDGIVFFILYSSDGFYLLIDGIYLVVCVFYLMIIGEFLVGSVVFS